MRLVCPNCDAKYEVPEDAIPETGRDVQCANCGHAWFQMRRRPPEAETAAAPVAAPAPVVAPAPEPAPEPVIEPVSVVAAALPEADAVEPAAAEPVVEAAAGPVADGADGEKADAAAEAPEPSVEVVAEAAEPVTEATVDVAEAEPSAAQAEAVVASPVDEQKPGTPDTELAEDDEAADAPASAAPIAAAYAVDDSVLAILREEAEREAQARKAEGKGLETQTELGIEAEGGVVQKSAVVADPVSGDGLADDRTGMRRTRLPDVEEINSTLRPAEIEEAEEGMDAPASAAESGGSFRSGFLLVMTIAILGSAVYGSADAISNMIPALSGPLSAYVSFVDSLRLHLDGLMQSATVAINGN